LDSTRFLPQQEITELMKSHNEGKQIDEIKRDIVSECKKKENTTVRSQVSRRLPDYHNRCDFLTNLGLGTLQEKRAFIFKNGDKLNDVNYKLAFSSVDAADIKNFKAMMKCILMDTRDRDDQQQIKLRGLEIVVQNKFKGIEEDFDYDSKWWQVGIFDGRQVGYILPVSFKDCAKDGLIEGTVFHIGVLPEFRNRGFGLELLVKGCEVLSGIGMWRIFCDTDSENEPMIRAFVAAGFKEVDTIKIFQSDIRAMN
jgi:ribosomal protein S18 acetylase RimI-like enzyme